MLHTPISPPVALFALLRRAARVFHDGRVAVWNYIPISSNSLLPRGLLSILHHPQDLTYTLHFQAQPALLLAGLQLPPVCFLASARELRVASIVGLNSALTLLSAQRSRLPKAPSTWMIWRSFFKYPRGDWKQLLNLYNTFHQLFSPLRNIQYYDNCLQFPACPRLPNWTSYINT